jgi:hypothetical protein
MRGMCPKALLCEDIQRDISNLDFGHVEAFSCPAVV